MQKKTGNWSNVENTNVSEITDMSFLFENIKGIKDLNLSKWDTSSAITMEHMFDESDFDSPLHFDTSNVTNMRCMFQRSLFDHPLHFDTSNVKKYDINVF